MLPSLGDTSFIVGEVPKVGFPSKHCFGLTNQCVGHSATVGGGGNEVGADKYEGGVDKEDRTGRKTNACCRSFECFRTAGFASLRWVQTNGHMHVVSLGVDIVSSPKEERTMRSSSGVGMSSLAYIEVRLVRGATQ